MHWKLNFLVCFTYLTSARITNKMMGQTSSVMTLICKLILAIEQFENTSLEKKSVTPYLWSFPDQYVFPHQLSQLYPKHSHFFLVKVDLINTNTVHLEVRKWLESNKEIILIWLRVEYFSKKLWRYAKSRN